MASESEADKQVCEFEIQQPDGEPLRVLVCGSRDWTNRASLRRELERLPKNATVIHGAYRGADRLAGEVADELGLAVIPFPADWDTLGPSAGPIRNSRMLKEAKPHFVIAFHPDKSQIPSGGTGDMVRKALAAGLPVKRVLA